MLASGLNRFLVNTGGSNYRSGGDSVILFDLAVSLFWIEILVLATHGTFIQSSVPGDSSPNVDFGALAIKDVSGNSFAAGGSVAATDRVAPVLLTASGTVGTRQLNITFSEPINPTGIQSTSFTLTNTNGVGAAGPLSNCFATGALVSCQAASDFIFADVGGSTPDQVQVLGGSSIQDLNNNVAVASGPIAIQNSNLDSVAPVAVSVETADLNEDFVIDALIVTFSKPVLDSSAEAAQFSVVAGGSSITVTSIHTGAAVNDRVLQVRFSGASPTAGTALTPQLGYRTTGTLLVFPLTR